jgi:hypothetical protein
MKQVVYVIMDFQGQYFGSVYETRIFWVTTFVYAKLFENRKRAEYTLREMNCLQSKIYRVIIDPKIVWTWKTNPNK